jgi:flagellar hook-associated protein 2
MVTATGLGSGLDIESLVRGLVAAERAPQENRLVRREAQTTSLISGFGQLKGALSAMQGSLSTLAEASTFTDLKATSSQASAVSVSASASAVPGTFSVAVNNLADSQSLISGGFASADAEVGTGTLTINRGTPTYAGTNPDTYTDFSVNPDSSPITVTITSANNTLEGIRDEINAQNAGVSASIIQDNGAFRLLLSSDETGVTNSLAITASGDGDGNNTDATGLSALAFDATTANLTQSRAAVDASYSINGATLSSASNTISDAVDGVSFTLLEATTSNATITVAENTQGVTDAVKALVNTYNNYIRTANALTDYDPATQRAGALQGDFSARSIISQVRNGIALPVGGLDTAFTSLAQIGITTTSTGALELDEAALSAALGNDRDGVAKLFAGGDVGGTTVEGIASRLDNVLSGYLGSGGVIASREASLNSTIEQIADEREVLERRLASIEERYRTQFNALDSLLANLTSTADFLQQQLDNLPGAYNPGRN